MLTSHLGVWFPSASWRVYLCSEKGVVGGGLSQQTGLPRSPSSRLPGAPGPLAMGTAHRLSCWLVPSSAYRRQNNFWFHSCLLGKTSLRLPVRFRICLPDKGMSVKTIFPLGRQNTDGGVRSLTISSCYIDGRNSAAWMLRILKAQLSAGRRA